MTDRTGRFNHRIITALSRNARLTMSALAKSVGLSKTPVQTRRRKLEASGIITGYSLRVDHLKLGRGDIAQFRRVLDEAAAALPHVSTTSTLVVMEEVKKN